MTLPGLRFTGEMCCFRLGVLGDLKVRVGVTSLTTLHGDTVFCGWGVVVQDVTKLQLVVLHLIGVVGIEIRTISSDGLAGEARFEDAVDTRVMGELHERVFLRVTGLCRLAGVKLGGKKQDVNKHLCIKCM